ncbi:MAG TPA: UDP-N-acetylmuramoyl-L-alanyl-D-glutamate--2,6-diaminopimelate ligase [Bacteroidales bacterium]|nr:UDP-N-acetylmuramoyl-L-alanyl-D-glutamate--2,6-diaminopimelate ligase [Bacteroidales bacterium]HPS46278.1 UDP-N-acetylmuramoyl-L-alanyl-D-glutamate--2,6-diaminopimelate ligase [Bacteroidales bacterium]HQH18940.1 UDP-N-acetylmuramoyl-L-alanyl-D-glutamate--2,6-diaminopimelate ligase [Bacteroidales bacterium]
MKQLKEILYKTRIEQVIGTTDVSIYDISFDSRNVKLNSLFIAVKGISIDGHFFIDNVIEAGARAIICETMPNQIRDGITYIQVKDSREALAYIASNFYDNPSSQIKLVGITGTNGKTTTASLLHQLFMEMGYRVGLLSTVCNKINNEIFPASHTTPDPIQLNAFLRKMIEAECSHCFMEVSSHAIDQHRITGLHFTGGIFSNITHDHLDYHKTFDAYITAKKKFFDNLSSQAFALSNVDDRNGMVMLQNTKALKYTYSLNRPAEFKAKVVENRISGLQLNVDGVDVWFKLVGQFNAYNILAIYASAVLLGVDKMEVLKVLSSLEAVDGRFEVVKSANGIVAIIDYAHTPDALKNVLSTISSVREGNENIITVVGCGGDRDRKKRPVMASIACEYSAKVVLTSDNPRSEDPETIIQEMLQGVDILSSKKVLNVLNRREAIKTAILLASPGDVILIAGKGHEKYQEVKGVKHPFDDKQIVKEIFEQ